MTVRAAVACAVAAALAGAPALVRGDDGVPSIATLRERVRAAEHRPAAFRETIVTTSSNGSVTTEHRLVRGEDERTIDDSGPFHAESGVIGGRRWRQNENGLTLDDREDPGNAAREPIATTVQRVREPVDGYAVAALNVRGWGRKDYVDAASWQIVRRERIGPNGVVVTTYDDVREDRGRTFAHHARVDDPVERTTSDTRVTEYVPGPVADAELARPADRRTLVTFPEGVTSVVLPASFDRHIYVHATVAGRGIDLILDSGASGIVLDADFTRALGLKTYDEHSNVIAGRVTYARTVVPEMRIGPLVLHDVVTSVVPLAAVRTGRMPTTGALGFDFFAQLGVTIDYEHGRVTVVPSSAFAAPADPLTHALQARLGRGIPMVDVSLDGTSAERFMLDTGGEGTLLIFDYFTRRNPDVVYDIEAPAFPSGSTLSGVGGQFATKVVFVRDLAIAGFDFRNVVGNRVISQQSYAQEADGVMGQELLRAFTVGFDYANSRVYLTPNAAGRKTLKL
jgi:predicted aspartyl protease